MFRNGRSGMLRAPDSGAGTGGTPDGSGVGNGGTSAGGTPADQPPAPTFETWYSGLDATAKGLFDSHVSGLKSSIAAERQEQAQLSKRIKDLTTKAEKGSDLEKQLADLQNALALTERKAAFNEDASRPEVGCGNPKAAYALAMAENLFDSRGRPDWNAIKQTAPELFRKPGPGNADGGAGQGNPPHLTMNDIIRRAAGRG